MAITYRLSLTVTKTCLIEATFNSNSASAPYTCSMKFPLMKVCQLGDSDATSNVCLLQSRISIEFSKGVKALIEQDGKMICADCER